MNKPFWFSWEKDAPACDRCFSGMSGHILCYKFRSLAAITPWFNQLRFVIYICTPTPIKLSTWVRSLTCHFFDVFFNGNRLHPQTTAVTSVHGLWIDISIKETVAEFGSHCAMFILHLQTTAIRVSKIYDYISYQLYCTQNYIVLYSFICIRGSLAKHECHNYNFQAFVASAQYWLSRRSIDECANVFFSW